MHPYAASLSQLLSVRASQHITLLASKVHSAFYDRAHSGMNVRYPVAILSRSITAFGREASIYAINVRRGLIMLKLESTRP